MVNAYFQNIQLELLKEISSSKKSLKIAVAWFTNNSLFDTLLEKCREGIQIELIIINDSINLRPYGLDFNQFIKEGGNLYFGSINNLMHHKFCIIDDNILINGSYNWTYWAENKNEENITVFKDENAILKSFTEEFRKLVGTKTKIQTIEPELLNVITDDHNFYNPKNIRLNENIGSAIDLANRGNQEISYKIFEKINEINPAKANEILQSEAAISGQLFNIVYKKISNKPIESKQNTYEKYCSIISKYIQEGDYINAIRVSNACATYFPGRFSVHAYCGDAKTKFNDLEGAKVEYRKALEYKYQSEHQSKQKIIYYNKEFTFSYFPHVDMYLRLEQKEKAIEILNEAVHEYDRVKMSACVTKAKKYLNDITSGQTSIQIK